MLDLIHAETWTCKGPSVDSKEWLSKELKVKSFSAARGWFGVLNGW